MKDSAATIYNGIIQQKEQLEEIEEPILESNNTTVAEVKISLKEQATNKLKNQGQLDENGIKVLNRNLKSIEDGIKKLDLSPNDKEKLAPLLPILKQCQVYESASLSTNTLLSIRKTINMKKIMEK